MRQMRGALAGALSSALQCSTAAAARRPVAGAPRWQRRAALQLRAHLRAGGAGPLGAQLLLLRAHLLHAAW